MSKDELTEEDVIRYLEECNESQDILGFCYIPEIVCSKILDLYQKEKEKNKELDEENTRQHELLGNIHQNYRDKITKIQERNKEIVDTQYTSKNKIKDKIKEVEELDMGYEGKWIIDLLEELLEEE